MSDAMIKKLLLAKCGQPPVSGVPARVMAMPVEHEQGVRVPRPTSLRAIEYKKVRRVLRKHGLWTVESRQKIKDRALRTLMYRAIVDDRVQAALAMLVEAEI
jgi:hypothetical protein